MLLDWIGHKTGAIKSDDEEILAFMRENGIDVKLFSPGLISDGRLAPITHRKLYIADGDHFITGGRNLGDEYLADDYAVGEGERDNAWHDLLYTVRGSETGRVLAEFYKNWQRAGGEMPLSLPKVNPTGGGTARVQSVTTDPHTRQYALRDAHTTAIRGAKKEIVAIYPYFSDDRFVQQLIAAKKANPALRVRVMMPEREEPVGGAIYYSLNRETARQLQAAGIEVRFFGGELKDGEIVERYSHMKALVIDGQFLSLGSANADARTYFDNHELNTLISNKTTAEAFMRLVVEPDWKAAGRTRPQDAPSLLERVKRRVLEWLDFLL
ncbi:MAG: phospholipase D-like domain-containing protein [Candidatus Sericytochromatia bacterium]